MEINVFRVSQMKHVKKKKKANNKNMIEIKIRNDHQHHLKHFSKEYGDSSKDGAISQFLFHLYLSLAIFYPLFI